MVKNKKLQFLGSISVIISLIFACLIGAKMLADTITMLLVQESVQDNAVLLKKINSFFGFYKFAHILFVGLSLIVIGIMIYVWWKDRTFKVMYFIVAIMIFTIVIAVMNRSLINWMDRSSALIRTLPVENVVSQGKDFLSVISTTLNKNPSGLLGAVLKSMAMDIIMLVGYLLATVVMIVRITTPEN